ncbi:GNAT family N-acetyltransferase [Streptomyces sp. NPDC006012]|uniref:GNAT family N-acetyltransferase n=1 Tax=Streptomyces sp. NPDC006012 TaxID=3364739 RepID=UPI0036CDBE73
MSAGRSGEGSGRRAEAGVVGLRPVVDADLEVFLAYEHDPEAVRRSRFVPRERDAFLAHWRGRVLGDPDCRAWTVTEDGEIAGNICSWGQDGRRFVGYWLGRAYWGRGVGSRALGLLLRQERTRPLYADPFAGNTASVRLLQRHGFEDSGSGLDDEGHVLLVLRTPDGTDGMEGTEGSGDLRA